MKCGDRFSARRAVLAFAWSLMLLPILRAERTPMHLFLLVGQSNMAGRGEIDSGDNAPLDHVWVLQRDGRWAPAVEPYHDDKLAAGAGLARTFAEAYLADHPGAEIGFIPAACGGSPLAAWQPGVFFEATRSYPWNDALLRTRRALQDGHLKGILWHQGESDAHPETAPVYEANLGALLSRFREALEAPDVPIILGQVGRFSAEGWSASHEQIDAANRALASREDRVDYATAEDLGANADGIHFNTAALRELGRRYYAAFRNLTQE